MDGSTAGLATMGTTSQLLPQLQSDILCIVKARAGESPILLIAPVGRENEVALTGIGEVGAAARHANRQKDIFARPLTGFEQHRLEGQVYGWV